jgi:hypothetical protein
MATYPRVPTGNNKQYTLDAQISAGATSLTLNQTVAGVVRAPGYLVIDRIDSSGNVTATKREYKYFTGVSGANLTGLSSSDGTDQVHAVGAIVEFVSNVGDENDKYSVFTTEHSDLGQHGSLPSLSYARVGNLVGLSQASLNTLNLTNLIASNGLNASGASISGVDAIRPTWVFSTLSGASTGIGAPVSMPASGTIRFVSVALQSPVSGASLILDVNKNNTSIFDTGTRISILGGGTFASTASIATKIFSAGNFMSVDQDTTVNSGIKTTLYFDAR